MSKDFTTEEYFEFMYNPANKFKCDSCPDNRGYSYGWNANVGPCGQQNCWVTMHCKQHPRRVAEYAAKRKEAGMDA